jgi:hypothetical protein
MPKGKLILPMMKSTNTNEANKIMLHNKLDSLELSNIISNNICNSNTRYILGLFLLLCVLHVHFPYQYDSNKPIVIMKQIHKIDVNQIEHVYDNG